MSKSRCVLLIAATCLLLAACGGRRLDWTSAAATMTAIAALPTETPAPTATPNADALRGLLSSEDWQDRQAVAQLLPTRTDIAASERAEMLLAAVATEVYGPIEADAPNGAYLSASSLLRLSYTRSLGALGPDALAALREAMASETPAVAERAVLALGYAGDRSVLPQLRALLTDTDDGDVRMLAAFLLGELRDRDAIPALQQALEDGYSVYYEGDADVAVTLYPVREQAFGALRKLGIEVQRLEDGSYAVRQP
ncbi:MAG: HEAT repeat domain-containing protein [Anaerolineae bacterium]